MKNADEREFLQSKEYMKDTLNFDLYEQMVKGTRLFIAGFVYPQLGKFNESMDIVDEYIKYDPFDLEALYIRSNLLWRSGEYTKAEKDALKILDIEPRYPDALLILSRIYMGRDRDIKKGCQYFAKYVLEKGEAGFHKDGESYKNCKRLGFVD